jgi:hypothetical protein
MRIAIVILTLSVLTTLLFLRGRSDSRRRRPVPAPVAPPAEPAPTKESFEIHLLAPPRLSENTIRLGGRLAVFVPCGAQYSTWRQFPNSIRFHLLQTPAGSERDFPDHTLSISDSNETYSQYGAEPCDCIVAKHFEMDLLRNYPALFTTPGRYELEAFYAGMHAPAVAFVLEP